MLPFRDEPLLAIGTESDVTVFLDDYTFYYLEDDVELFREYVNNSGLMEVIVSLYPTSANDAEASMIGTLKHPFAYAGLLSYYGGFDEINSLGIPYLREAENDLNCSLWAVRNDYFKNATQLLRSALESVVTHLYFSTIGVTYDDLSALHIPPMNDKARGMLAHLVSTGLVAAEESRKISSLYRSLSAATHSQYLYLDVKYEETSDADKFMGFLSSMREVSIACILMVLNMEKLNIHATVDLRASANT